MADIKVTLATQGDREQLLEWFQHYQSKEAIEKRVDCYLSHGFTVMAKDKTRLVGVLQWYVKEDPGSGVAEFEEVYVSENYRGKGVGSALVQFAVQSVEDHFRAMGARPRRIFLFVDRTDKVARALYEKHGFEMVSDVEALFRDDEIVSLYVLRLLPWAISGVREGMI